MAGRGNGLKTHWWRSGGEFKKGNIPQNHRGYKLSEEAIKNISEGHKGAKNGMWGKGYLNAGEKNSNWKGGITPQYIKDYNCKEYKRWRENIFKRDEYTCQKCGQIGNKLNAHHIKPRSKFRQLRYELNNGVTLCFCCHKKVKNEF